jgi:hypothetical protein
MSVPLPASSATVYTLADCGAIPGRTFTVIGACTVTTQTQRSELIEGFAGQPASDRNWEYGTSRANARALLGAGLPPNFVASWRAVAMASAWVCEPVAASAAGEDLAELADLHRTYISMVERSIRNISVDALSGIADALDLPPSQLLRQAERLRGSKTR